jgi:hypothetical protein
MDSTGQSVGGPVLADGEVCGGSPNTLFGPCFAFSAFFKASIKRLMASP